MDVYDISSDTISIAELKDFDVGDTVRYGDGGKQVGVVLEQKNHNFMWPDQNGEEVEASPEEPVYIVARATGGAKPFDLSDLESINSDEAFGVDEDTVEKGIKDLRSTEENASVPGVDDPGVGFDSWPDSWEKSEKPNRLILLDAWSSMGGTWKTCYSGLGSKRLCSAMKDEVYGTEGWRGGFGME